MRIAVITDNIPRSFQKWRMYKIPSTLVVKSVKNSSIELPNGIKYVFISRAEKLYGVEIDSVILDENHTDIKKEIVDEVVFRCMVRKNKDTKER